MHSAVEAVPNGATDPQIAGPSSNCYGSILCVSRARYRVPFNSEFAPLADRDGVVSDVFSTLLTLFGM